VNKRRGGEGSGTGGKERGRRDFGNTLTPLCG